MPQRRKRRTHRRREPHPARRTRDRAAQAQRAAPSVGSGGVAMKWNWPLATCGLAVVLAIGSARADDEFNRKGAFAGAGASFEIPAFQGILTGRGGDSWGFNVRGGYRFNEYVAA